MDPQVAYEYATLSPGKNICVLVLQSARKLEDPIRCVLCEISLEEVKKHEESYEALSYVWGSRTGDNTILCDGKLLHVTYNCLTALRYVRRSNQDRVLWVDAVCINQNCTKEQNHQVELMGDIYSSALQVLIWFGEGDAETKKLLRFFRHLTIYRKFVKDYLSKVPGLMIPEFGKIKGQKAEALREILKHSWFERAWTFQEIGLASHPVVYCGRDSVTWDLFVHYTWSNSKSIKSVPLGFNIYSSFQGRSLCQKSLKNRDFSRDTMNEVIHKLIFHMRARKSSDPKDKVYALHQLFRNAGSEPPGVDYHKSTAMIYEEQTIALIKQTRCLSMLSITPSSQREYSLPSWVPDFTQEAHSYVWPICTIARQFRDDFYIEAKPGKLTVEGILRENVTTVASQMPHSFSFTTDRDQLVNPNHVTDCLSEWIRIAHELGVYPTGESAVICLGMLLLRLPTISEPKKEEALSKHRVAFQTLEFLASTCYDADLRNEFAEFVEQEKDSRIRELPPNELCSVLLRSNAPLNELLHSMTTSTQDCHLFTTSQGRLGITSGNLKADDIVALLHGATSPMILRPSGEHYNLIGPALIYGVSLEDWPATIGEEEVHALILV